MSQKDFTNKQENEKEKTDRQKEREKSVVIMIITNSSRTKLMMDEFNKIKGHYAGTEEKKSSHDQILYFFTLLFCLKLNIEKKIMIN